MTDNATNGNGNGSNDNINDNNNNGGMSVSDWILSLATSASRSEPIPNPSSSSSSLPSLTHGTLCACQSSLVHIGVLSPSSLPSSSSSSSSSSSPSVTGGIESLQRFRMSLSNGLSLTPLQLRFITHDHTSSSSSSSNPDDRDRVTVRFEFDEKKGSTCTTSSGATINNGNGNGTAAATVTPITNDDHTHIDISITIGSAIFIILNDSSISKSMDALRRHVTAEVPSSLPAAVLVIRFASRVDLKSSDGISSSIPHATTSALPPSSPQIQSHSSTSGTNGGRVLSLQLPFDQSLEGSSTTSSSTSTTPSTNNNSNNNNGTSIGEETHELGDGNGISISVIPLEHRVLSPDFVDRLYDQLRNRSPTRDAYPFTIDRPGFGPLTPSSLPHLLSPPRSGGGGGGHMRSPSAPRTSSLVGMNGNTSLVSSSSSGLSSISGDGDSDDDDDTSTNGTGVTSMTNAPMTAAAGPTVINGDTLHDMIAAMHSACPNALMIKLLRSSQEARIIDEKDGLIAGDRRRIEAMADIFDYRVSKTSTCSCDGAQSVAAVAAAVAAVSVSSSSNSSNELKVPGSSQPRQRLSIQLSSPPSSLLSSSSSSSMDTIDKNQCAIYALKSLIANGGRNILLSILDRCVAFVTGMTAQSSELESPNPGVKPLSSSSSGAMTPSSSPPNKFPAPTQNINGTNGNGNGNGDDNNDNNDNSDGDDDTLDDDARDAAIKNCAPLEGSLVRLLWTLTELCKNPKLLSSCTGKLRERFLETSIHKADVIATSAVLLDCEYVINVSHGGRQWQVRRTYNDIATLHDEIQKCLVEQSVASLVTLQGVPREPGQRELAAYRDDVDRASSDASFVMPVAHRLASTMKSLEVFLQDLLSPAQREWLLPPPAVPFSPPRVLIHRFFALSPKSASVTFDSSMTLSRIMSRSIFNRSLTSSIDRHTRARTLPKEVIQSLFDILMGKSSTSTLGDFADSPLMADSSIMPLLLQSFPAAPHAVCLDALKHLVRHLVQHPSNSMFFHVDPKARWQSWFLPLFVPLPYAVLFGGEKKSVLPRQPSSSPLSSTPTDAHNHNHDHNNTTDNSTGTPPNGSPPKDGVLSSTPNGTPPSDVSPLVATVTATSSNGNGNGNDSSLGSASVPSLPLSVDTTSTTSDEEAEIREREERLNEFNLTLLLFVLVHSECFMSSKMRVGDSRSLHAMLSESITVLAEAVKWEPIAASIFIKTFMEALIRKITHQARSWRNNPNSCSWDNLTQVISVMKELIFYSSLPSSLISSTMALATSNTILAKNVISQLTSAGISSLAGTSVNGGNGERSNSLRSLRRPSFGADRKSSGRVGANGISIMFVGSPPRIWKRKIIASITALATNTSSSSSSSSVGNSSGGKRDSKSGAADGNAMCLLDSSTLELLTTFLDSMDYNGMDDTIALYGLDTKDIELVKSHKRQGLADIAYFVGSLEGMKRNEEDALKLPCEPLLDLPAIPIRSSTHGNGNGVGGGGTGAQSSSSSMRSSQSSEGKSLMKSKRDDRDRDRMIAADTSATSMGRLSMILDGLIVGRPHLMAPPADALDASPAIILYCPCSLLKRMLPRTRTIGATAIWRTRQELTRTSSNDVSLSSTPSNDTHNHTRTHSHGHGNDGKDDSKSLSIPISIVGPVTLMEEKLELTIACRKVPQGSYLVGLFEMDTVARKLRFLARTEVCNESRAPIFDPPLVVAWKKGEAQRLKFNVYQVQGKVASVEEKDRLGSVLVRVDDIGGHLEEELTCKLQHGKTDSLDKKLTADGSILVLRAKRIAQPPPGLPPPSVIAAAAASGITSVTATGTATATSSATASTTMSTSSTSATDRLSSPYRTCVISSYDAFLTICDGRTMTKYASSSDKVEMKDIFYRRNGGLGAIYWAQQGRRAEEASRCIPLRSITSIREASHSEAFKRLPSSSKRDRCFSIISRDRTLDLEAESVEVKNIFIYAIHQLLVLAGAPFHEEGWDRDDPRSDGKITHDGNICDAMKLLTDGGKFMKFPVGRGRPEAKFVFISDSPLATNMPLPSTSYNQHFIPWNKSLYWIKPNATVQPGKTLAHAIAQLTIAAASSGSFLPLIEVKDAVAGKQSAVFTKGANHAAPADKCMSVISKTRTLDLQTDTTPQRDAFVLSVRRCIHDCKLYAARQYLRVVRRFRRRGLKRITDTPHELDDFPEDRFEADDRPLAEDEPREAYGIYKRFIAADAESKLTLSSDVLTTLDTIFAPLLAANASSSTSSSPSTLTAAMAMAGARCSLYMFERAQREIYAQMSAAADRFYSTKDYAQLVSQCTTLIVGSKNFCVPEGVIIRTWPSHIGTTRRLHLKKRCAEKKNIPLFALLRTDEGFAAFDNHLRERDKAYIHQLHFWRLIEAFKLSCGSRTSSKEEDRDEEKDEEKVSERILYDDEIADAIDIYRRFLSPSPELPVELPSDVCRILDERLVSSSVASSSRITLSIFDASIRHARNNIATLRRAIATLR